MAPAIENLKCIQCECTESLLWKQINDSQHICITCFEKTQNTVKAETESANQITNKTEDRKTKLRKSTRSTRYSKSGSNQSQSNSNKGANIKTGKGRRSLFRRPPMKAPTVTATTKHVKSLFHKVNSMVFYIHFSKEQKKKQKNK